MALPASGLIHMSSLNVEVGRATTYNSNLNETIFRTLANKATGIISLADFYGKSYELYGDGSWIWDDGAGLQTYVIRAQDTSGKGQTWYYYFYFNGTKISWTNDGATDPLDSNGRLYIDHAPTQKRYTKGLQISTTPLTWQIKRTAFSVQA